MAGNRKELVGSYLTEQEAMDKINWLKEEGYRSEEIFLIKDMSGVVEPFQENPSDDLTSQGHHDSGMMAHSNMDPLHASDSLERTFFRSSQEDGVASSLMEMGIEREEAYRYEYDVKVGKVLILTESKNSSVPDEHSRSDRYLTEEEPALQFEETDEMTDEPVQKPSNSWSVNRPLTDDNIDINRPLDERMMTSWNEGRLEETAATEQLEEEHTKETMMQSKTVNPMQKTDEKPRHQAVGNSHTTKYEDNPYADSKVEITEDYDKLLHEHGQPYPMEKKEPEDSYDSSVMQKYATDMGNQGNNSDLNPSSSQKRSNRTDPQLQGGQSSSEKGVTVETDGTVHMRENPVSPQKAFIQEEPMLKEEDPLMSERPETEYTPDLMDEEQQHDTMQLEPGNDYVGEETVYMEEDLMNRDEVSGEPQHSSLFEEDESYSSERKPSTMNRKKGFLHDKGTDHFNPYRK